MGTPGHMAHPFDVDRIRSGQDLVNYFYEIVNLLSQGKITGSVKIDGINVSFKLVTDKDGKKTSVWIEERLTQSLLLV